MQEFERKEGGLWEAIAITRNGQIPQHSEADAKMLCLFLHEGECTAEITESIISVWYSWLPRLKPSTYFICLAPALVWQLMQLGKVRQVDGEATFQVGSGTAGAGRYVARFGRKWIRIRCETDRIIIWVRDQKKDLGITEPMHFCEAVRCARCNGELRSPLAKQCVQCGFDWH